MITNQISQNQALTPEIYRDYFEKAISYQEYLSLFEQLLQDSSYEYADKMPLNWQRTKRLSRTITVPQSLRNCLINLKEPLYWIIISEPWCGDSSQILPVFSQVAEASNGNIQLGIILRDTHPEFMNAHLTNSSRSIPKLVQLNNRFEVVGNWGPRPLEAQQLVVATKSNPETADRYQEILHKWYADNKQQFIFRDISTLLEPFCGLHSQN